MKHSIIIYNVRSSNAKIVLVGPHRAASFKTSVRTGEFEVTKMITSVRTGKSYTGFATISNC